MKAVSCGRMNVARVLRVTELVLGLVAAGIVGSSGGAGTGLAPLAAAAVAQPSRPVTIVHYHHTWHGSPWRSYLSEMERAYEAAHPNVDIKIVDVPGHEYLTKVSATSAAGLAPDILETYPDSAAPYLERGLILPLDSFVAADKIDMSVFIPQVVQDFTWRDQLWSMPISTYPILTLYNASLLDESGLPEPYRLKDEWDWQAVIEYGRKLTVDKNGDGTPDQWGIKAYWSLNRWFIFVHQAGGSLYDRPVEPRESRFNTPPVRYALEWLCDLYFTYKVTSIELLDLANQNLAISLSDGPTSFRSPALLRRDSLLIPIGVAPMPKGPDNSGTALFANGFQIASGSQHPQEAWEWVKFLTLNEANVLRFARLTARPPAMKKLVPDYPGLLPAGAINGAAFAAISLYPKNVPDVVSKHTYEIEQAVNPLMLQVLRGELAPQAAQQKMHESVSAILKR